MDWQVPVRFRRVETFQETVHQRNQMVVLRQQARSCIELIRGIAEVIDLAAQRSVTGSR